MAHLWGWYLDLCQTRQSGGFGPARITRLEIQAWEQDERIRLEPWERRALMRLDAEHLLSMTPKAKEG